MTLLEIYDKLSNHILTGMMIHEQMANYYDFLGLEGYKRCHEYHFFKETMHYRNVCRYFINHHNMLIPEGLVDVPDLIPESWYMHSRQDVDQETKRKSVKLGLEKWVEWERDTKKFYQDMYNELLEIGKTASALEIACLIKDVDCELKKAERYHLNKEAIGYDMTVIVAEQKKKHNKYKKKCEKELHIDLC